MKNNKFLMVTILFFFLVISCQNKNREEQLNQKEKELLIKENELLRSELEKSDSLKTNINSSFIVDETVVKKLFLKYLPDFSEGRELATCNIELGDLNGDNLLDAVVDYGLDPTFEDTGYGNAISEFPGLIAFINNGTNLRIVDHSEDFGGNSGSRNELKKINNGIIYLEGLDYSEEDARCCPTIKTKTKIILRNNKLVKI